MFELEPILIHLLFDLLQLHRLSGGYKIGHDPIIVHLAEGFLTRSITKLLVDNRLDEDENILTGGGVILGGMVVICDMILTVIAVILNLFLVISMRNSKVNKLASFLWIFQ